MIPEQTLDRERSFFDLEAESLDDRDLVIPHDVVERYRNGRISSRNIPKDSLFAFLRPLEGKKILDYGCGHGENACLLATCGALVTAFDLSPVAVDKARRRAEMNNVLDRIQFDVREATRTGYDPRTFDAVLGQSILHHLHQDLASVFREIAQLLKPGGTAYFVEPVANSATLRLLRRLIPVPLYATEDERQLVYADLEPMHEFFSSVELHHFFCLERLHRILGDKVRRPLRAVDYHLQRFIPPLRRFYGEVLIVARTPPSRCTT